MAATNQRTPHTPAELLAIRNALDVLSDPRAATGRVLGNRVHLTQALEFSDQSFQAKTCGIVRSVNDLPSGRIYELDLDGDNDPPRLVYEDDLAAGCLGG